MHIAFRVDASIEIGAGHIMRCLTLADAMRVRGAKSTFFCRPHAGHLMDLIRERGHKAIALAPPDGLLPNQVGLAHSKWLGTDWSRDADQTREVIGDQVVDWLVVDHYALDYRWEKALSPCCNKLMVIDDLADRLHVCNLLLDQTYSRQEQHYHPLVHPQCRILTGAKYALLRPEFAALRSYSLNRRTGSTMQQLLITMGGVDKDNTTEKVLQALQDCPLPENCLINIVMGVTAPWLKDVVKSAKKLPWNTRVLVGVRNMAQLMADSDLAIASAGGTSWELCCLGVPSLIVCIADNQRAVVDALVSIKATLSFDQSDLNNESENSFRVKYLMIEKDLESYSLAAASVNNGSGIHLVCDEIIQFRS